MGGKYWPMILIAAALVLLFAVARAETRCQDNPSFFLRGTHADCAAVQP
jgi:hypothetical protein